MYAYTQIKYNSHPLSKQFFAEEVVYYRDPQLFKTQRIIDCDMPSSQRDIYNTNPAPKAQETSCKIGRAKGSVQLLQDNVLETQHRCYTNFQ